MSLRYQPDVSQRPQLRHRVISQHNWRPMLVALATAALLAHGCGGSSSHAGSGPDGGLLGSGGGTMGIGGTTEVVDVDMSQGGAGGAIDANASQGGAGGTIDANASQGGAGGAIDANVSQGGAGGVIDANASQGGAGGGRADSGQGGASSGGQGGSSAPICGEPGFGCCAGNTCNGGGCCVSGICMQPGGTCVGLGGGTCNAGVCGTCGGAGLPCCGATPATGACTSPGTICSNGVCAKCGEVGLACCPGANSGAGTCNAANTVCNGNLCASCGAPGTACCPGNQCASPGCCYNNSCLAENAACGTSAGTCQAGKCSDCGHSGQACCGTSCYDGLQCNNGLCSSCGHAGEACCPAGGSSPPCQAGTTCSSAGSDGVCARCGGLGDVCCAGNTCASGCCSGGRCIAASGACPTVPTNCGNSVLNPEETCDDGNTSSGDGCSADCSTVEPGWECRVPGRKCTPLCGDGVLTGSETCDDGNTGNGDGCSSTCQLEPGGSCPTPGKACTKAECGNGKLEVGEICDCGNDPNNLPSGCKSVNGFFYGDGNGCSKACSKEPICKDSNGKTQVCSSTCGDGNVDPGEACEDGNQLDGDGCSSTCTIEKGFTCSNVPIQDSSTCRSGSGRCLELPIIYRDFQPENVSSGGHPDFPFLGTKYNGSLSPTTICVPNTGGPAKGSDATARCWGIVADTLLNGKPQPGPTTACSCQFSEWNVSNSSRIPNGYTVAGNDSPLSDGNGGYLGAGGTAINTISTSGAYTGFIVGSTTGSPVGPIFKGTVPAYRDAASFGQWFNDDPTVNQTFTDVLELSSIGTNIYQFASKSHLAQGGFFPLDALDPSQATLCNLWPYWNHGSGTPFWSTCQGDQYLFPPRVLASDCPATTTLSDGCWVKGVAGTKHDSYFTDETRYYFVYDGSAGLSLSFYGDDDLFVFINGILVLDLGGIHQQLPGTVTVTDSPGDAKVTEGGCLDSAGNITGVTAGSKACSPASATVPSATTPDDFRVRTVSLGLITGKVYEIAIFGADRHPPESNFQLTLSGYATKRSNCAPRCGDGVVAAGEECDCGDGSVAAPAGCTGPNSDAVYGGCTSQCRFGPYCGDGVKNGPEACDLGKRNGDTSLGKDGCTIGCTKPPYCGDGNVDASLGEECDLGSNNGQPGYKCSATCTVVL